MKRDDAVTLVRYCRHRVADQLRTVFVYGRDDAEVIYVRDDLRQQYTEAAFTRFVATARDLHADLQTSGVDQSTIGNLLSTVHVFENAYAFQFPGWEDGGVVATFDHTVGIHLHEFIEDCWSEIAGTDAAGE